MRYLLAISVGILLTACDVSEVTRSLSIPLPGAYSGAAPVSPAARADLEWWRNFNDPVLDRLVGQGLTGSLSVAEARARLSEAEAQARAAGVLWRGDGEIGAAARSQGLETANLDLGAAINLAGAQQRRAEAALARLDAARSNVSEARRLLVTELSISYMNLRFFQQRLVNRRQDLASRQQTAAAVQTQLEGGAATKLDTLRAQALAAEVGVEIPGIEAEIVRQRNLISTLLGVPVGALPVDLRYPGRQPAPRRVADLGVPADLLRARPDIRRAEALYAAALAEVDAAQAARYPSLSLSGSIVAPLSGGSAIESLAAGLVLPVFNQPALAAEVDAAEARVRQAYLRWSQLVLTAVEEVETAQVALRSALQAQAAARRVVGMYEESLALSRQLLAGQGDTTVIDLIDSERALSQARLALAQTTRDVAVAYIDLRAALGEGHDLTPEAEQVAAAAPDG